MRLPSPCFSWHASVLSDEIFSSINFAVMSGSRNMRKLGTAEERLLAVVPLKDPTCSPQNGHKFKEKVRQTIWDPPRGARRGISSIEEIYKLASNVGFSFSFSQQPRRSSKDAYSAHYDANQQSARKNQQKYESIP